MDERKQEQQEQEQEQTEDQENEQDVEGQSIRSHGRDDEGENPKEEGEGAYRWSDRRFKREVQPLSGALARLTRLR